MFYTRRFYLLQLNLQIQSFALALLGEEFFKQLKYNITQYEIQVYQV